MDTQSSTTTTGPPDASGGEAGRVQRRVQLLVEITSRVGEYRRGLTGAGRKLTAQEATVIADLEHHGLDVPQLREVLWGGHVLVDDPDLYEKWRFPKSRERLSSHHKTIDKEKHPDLGLVGPLVREKLHGRTAAGTWVQLEKTPAAMGNGFRLPTFNDLVHLWDFIVYRVTKSNVGPWGLSRQTERRPIYLSPTIVSTMPVPEEAEAELSWALEFIEDADDVTSASPDLAKRFPPPERGNTRAELTFDPGSRNGRGLFGASEVHVRGLHAQDTVGVLDEARTTRPTWALPDHGETIATTVRGGNREIRTVVRRVPATQRQEDM